MGMVPGSSNNNNNNTPKTSLPLIPSSSSNKSMLSWNDLEDVTFLVDGRDTKVYTARYKGKAITAKVSSSGRCGFLLGVHPLVGAFFSQGGIDLLF